MINRIKKYIASIVAGVMLFVPTANAFAASDIQDEGVINYEVNSDELDNIVDELDEELTKDVLKENFNNLSEEEKQVFLNEIKYDEELLNFHKKNIDPSCTIQKPTRVKRSASALAQVRTGLQALNLPTPVYYSLVSFASSLVGAVADGPLPVGDIAALGTGVVSGIVVGYYWDDIAGKTGSIKNVFTRAFRTAGGNISRALDTLFAKAKSKTSKPTGNKVKDVKARLKKEGFQKVGQKGSHEQWKKGSKRVTVPNHGENKEIAIGTLRNIWKQAGWI
ncbi:type II toxin-antitoxin system HicA family toxin [Romboutsia lituseburensis]|uniref:type II toxin-antitoxin system HicA family toxin n=1 Tax=Romboutsia lituseburensis TaxID=1537 RepID=UPI0022EB9FB4|nr:type II toxin-antitoxin system HicA family toxin [Romboutsia lituseburensis]